MKQKGSASKKKIGTDTGTKIGLWFWFLVPKSVFGRTLT